MKKGKNAANVYLSDSTGKGLQEILGMRFTLSGFVREAVEEVLASEGLRKKIIARLDAAERARRGL